MSQKGEGHGLRAWSGTPKSADGETGMSGPSRWRIICSRVALSAPPPAIRTLETGVRGSMKSRYARAMDSAVKAAAGGHRILEGKSLCRRVPHQRSGELRPVDLPAGALGGPPRKIRVLHQRVDQGGVRASRGRYGSFGVVALLPFRAGGHHFVYDHVAGARVEGEDPGRGFRVRAASRGQYRRVAYAPDVLNDAALGFAAEKSRASM